jgi:hypothetical protein
MRALILLLILAILLLIVGVASGFLNISRIRGAKAPEVSATRNGLSAKGGEAPAFDVETGSVKVGSKETKVKVPTLVVQKPGTDQNQVAVNNAM